MDVGKEAFPAGNEETMDKILFAGPYLIWRQQNCI